MDKLYTIFKKLEGAYADSTIRAYQKNMVTFAKFCKTYNFPILPTSAEAIVHFIDCLVEEGC
jgi:hypothetical protein